MRRFNDSLSTKVYHWIIKSFFVCLWFNIYKLIRSNITMCYKVLTHSLRFLSIFPFLIVISCTWIDPIAPIQKYGIFYFKIILHINQKIQILTKDVCIFKPSVFIPLFTFTCIIKIFEQLQMKKIFCKVYMT